MPVAQRVQMLTSRLSLGEKFSLVTGAGPGQPYVFEIAAIPALCVPAVGFEDGPSGVGDGLAGVTQLPAAVSLAATWDPALARSYGEVIGAEELAKGASVDLGPTVNIDRDPRWGRSFETFTEDPYLDASLAAAEVGGIQGQGVMSEVKHFAVYNQETARNTPADDAVVSQRALQEIYLPGFWGATVGGSAAAVMCGYSLVNGQYACQNPTLLSTILDGEWGFTGFVGSDAGATHSTVASAAAGLDLEMPGGTYYGTALQSAVEWGRVSQATLDQMVSRVLTEMFRFGDFNRPTRGSPSAVATSAAHQGVSTAVAEAGTVLLKNSGGLLPLTASGAGSIAVIGPAASVASVDSGGGSAYVVPPFTVTPLQGIEAAAGPGTTVQYAQGLPSDTSLPLIPSGALNPPFSATGLGGTYSGTLTAPETGTYVLAFANPASYATTDLSLDGSVILANPGTPPVSTYSVAVQLQAGAHYALRLSGAGASAQLRWATPSFLDPWLTRAADAARSASTAIVVVADDTESEGADRVGLALPGAQDALVTAVAAANPRTVVVVDAGAPITMPWLGSVASVVDAWYPGESNGTALAAVLFGAVDPGGHLPVTFPRSLAQVPAQTPAEFPGVGRTVQYSEGIDVGYRYYQATAETPLFAFGFGLSYTDFTFTDLTVTPPAVQLPAAGPGSTGCGCDGQGSPLVTVSATVTNTGSRSGSDVVQLYLGDPAAAGEPPEQLEGFQRVELSPGQATEVSFTLDAHALSFWNDAANGWTVAGGQFSVLVGDSSAPTGLPLRGSFTVSTTS
jgi:beta-glucosidase